MGSRLVAKFIDLGMLLCLARFLGPAEFGLVATAMAVVFVVEALFELPVAAALMRMPSVTTDMLHTAFTLSLIRGLTIASLLVALSFPLAAFNDEPRLVGLLAVLALAPALRGLVSPRLVEFSRAFNFRPDTAMELSGKAVAFVVSIAIAVTTRSYWAIAAATVCAPLVSTMLSYFIAPLRPRLTLSKWQDFSNLIGWNFVSQLCGALNWQIDRLLLPRFTTSAELGQYAMGKQLSEIPIQALIAPLHRPTMAALASAGHSQGQRFLKLSGAVAFLLLPILSISLIWPEALVRIGLGPAWSFAAEWLRLISAVAIIGIPAMLLPPLTMTLNRTRWLATKTMVELFARAPLMLVGVLYFGVIGAIYASAIATTIGMVMALLVTRQLLGVGIVAQLATMRRPVLAMVPAGAALQSLKSSITVSENLLQVLMHAVPSILLCLGIYLAVTALLWWLEGRPPGLEQELARRLAHRFGRLRYR